MNPRYTHAIVASAVALVPFVSFVSCAIADEPDYSAIVTKHASSVIEAELIPGAVIGIYKDGQASFYPIGTLNFDQDQAPTIETLYEIGSISKVITGTLFADAIRRGEVTRDTLVNDLLPDGYEVQAMEGEDLRLWHLTTHTSGWGTAPLNLVPKDGEKPFTGYTQEMLFEATKIMPMKQKPGTKLEYSNFAVGVLGTLISINANGEYEALVKERIIEPLGIENFTIDLSEDQLEHLAPATAGGRNTKAWGKTGAMDPCGMWVTNAPGLLDFAIANIEGGELDIHESLAMSRELLFESDGGQVCHGWFKYGDGTTFWHNGMTGGYSAYMAVNPTHNVAVVLLANGAAFETTTIGMKILQTVMGMNPEPIEIEIANKIDTNYTDRIIGVYNSTLGFDMTITAARGKVFAQLTGQQALELVLISDNRFRIKLVDAEIGFDVPEEGYATSVTLFQNGMEMKCERKD